MVKLGDRNRAFTRKALEIASQTPDFLPRSFDIAEMRRDLELFEALQPMLLALTRLRELVDDTVVAAGDEAYRAALEIYRYAKANGSVAGFYHRPHAPRGSAAHGAPAPQTQTTPELLVVPGQHRRDRGPKLGITWAGSPPLPR